MDRIKRYACYVGLLLMVFTLVMVGCNPETTPSRSFGSAELLVQLDAFPDHWDTLGTTKAMGADSGLGIGDEEDSYAMFTVDGMHTTALNFIYQLGSSEAAKQLYDAQLAVEFRDGSIVRNVPWTTPPRLSYVSPYTERMHVACTIIAGGQTCKVMAQYEEYVTVFRSAIGDHAMSLEQFSDVVQYIDKRFAERLKMQQVGSG